VKPKRMHIMPTFAIVAALSWFATSPVFAASEKFSHSSGPILGSEAKRIRQQERTQQGRREASYHSWFYRKYGSYPTAAQFRDWHYRSYGVYPS
jgi:hypothetical protein